MLMQLIAYYTKYELKIIVIFIYSIKILLYIFNKNLLATTIIAKQLSFVIQNNDLISLVKQAWLIEQNVRLVCFSSYWPELKCWRSLIKATVIIYYHSAHGASLPSTAAYYVVGPLWSCNRFNPYPLVTPPYPRYSLPNVYQHWIAIKLTLL